MLNESLIAQFGAMGLLVLAQAYAVVNLWRRLKEAQEKLEKEHDARLMDAKENTKAMLELADRTTEAIRELKEKIPRSS